MQYLPDFLGRFSFSVSSISGVIFFIFATVVAVVSAILLFHWRKYGMGGKTLALAELCYLVGTVLLLAIAFFSLN